MANLLLKNDSLKIIFYNNYYYQADTERTAPMYVTICNDKYLRCTHLLNGTNSTLDKDDSESNNYCHLLGYNMDLAEINKLMYLFDSAK